MRGFVHMPNDADHDWDVISSKQPETLIEGDYQFGYIEGALHRWPKDKGMFGNGQPEKVPANEISTGLRERLLAIKPRS